MAKHSTDRRTAELDYDADDAALELLRMRQEFARIVAKDGAFSWLRDNGRENLITETVNASTPKAMIKAMILKGEDVPADLFAVSPYQRASITRRGV